MRMCIATLLPRPTLLPPRRFVCGARLGSLPGQGAVWLSPVAPEAHIEGMDEDGPHEVRGGQGGATRGEG